VACFDSIRLPSCVQAKRAGVSTIILPAANKSDYAELPDFIRDGLVVHFADTFAEVHAIAFAQE
jgi:ATP-dependent Lon protease